MPRLWHTLSNFPGKEKKESCLWFVLKEGAFPTVIPECVFPYPPLGAIQSPFHPLSPMTLHLPNPKAVLALIFLQLSFAVTQAITPFTFSKHCVRLCLI